MNVIRCAKIENGIIINIDIIDAESPLIQEWGIVPIPLEVPAAIGWLYRNGSFIEPEIIPPELPPEEMQALARQEKNRRQEEAEKVITVLERAARRGQATAEQLQRLDAWEDYSIKLDQVDITQPEITWPKVPDE